MVWFTTLVALACVSEIQASTSTCSRFYKQVEKTPETCRFLPLIWRCPGPRDTEWPVALLAEDPEIPRMRTRNLQVARKALVVGSRGTVYECDTKVCKLQTSPVTELLLTDRAVDVLTWLFDKVVVLMSPDRICKYFERVGKIPIECTEHIDLPQTDECDC